MEAAGGPRLGLVAVIGILAAVAALSVLLKTLMLEQPVSRRTLLLCVIAAAGAGLAALPLAGLARLFAAHWRPGLRASLAALWMASGFVPATMFAFAVENRIVEGHIEADSVLALGAAGLFWTLFGAMGMFTPTGLAYLLPWPALAVASAAFLCFYRWPVPSYR
jgi:hypothetical protein